MDPETDFHSQEYFVSLDTWRAAKKEGNLYRFEPGWGHFLLASLEYRTFPYTKENHWPIG